MALEYRRFGPPVLLSLGLHGLVVVGLGAVPMGPAVVPAAAPALMVEMVEASTSESPAPTPMRTAVQKAVNKHSLEGRQVGVKKVARVVPVRATTPTAPERTRATLVVPAAHVPARKLAAVAELIADEVSVAEPAVRPSAFSPLEFAGPSRLAPPAMGVAAPVSRPLPSAEGAARMLRDTVASGAPGRTRVRMGNNPRPDYPRLAREAGWEGTVVLLVEVRADGTAGTIVLHKSSGHPVLDEAASVAVQDWRFVPAMDGSFPIMSVVQLPVRFDLQSAQAN